MGDNYLLTEEVVEEVLQEDIFIGVSLRLKGL